MKTYAEKQGEKPFDWNAFLNAKIEDRDTAVDDTRAEFLAGGWVTCACGNLCAEIPREWIGAPFDNKLKKLGGRFYAHIKGKDWAKAQATLTRIEARSAKLLKQLKRP